LADPALVMFRCMIPSMTNDIDKQCFRLWRSAFRFATRHWLETFFIVFGLLFWLVDLLLE
jgi:hypothetical protein